MPANPDGTSTEPQPNKNTEDINNSKNKNDTSNKEQISEKEKQTEQEKSNHELTFLLQTIKVNPSRRFEGDSYGQ